MEEKLVDERLRLGEGREGDEDKAPLNTAGPARSAKQKSHQRDFAVVCEQNRSYKQAPYAPSYLVPTY